MHVEPPWRSRPGGRLVQHLAGGPGHSQDGHRHCSIRYIRTAPLGASRTL